MGNNHYNLAIISSCNLVIFDHQPLDDESENKCGHLELILHSFPCRLLVSLFSYHAYLIRGSINLSYCASHTQKVTFQLLTYVFMLNLKLPAVWPELTPNRSVTNNPLFSLQTHCTTHPNTMTLHTSVHYSPGMKIQEGADLKWQLWPQVYGHVTPHLHHCYTLGGGGASSLITEGWGGRKQACCSYVLTQKHKGLFM